MAQDERRGRKNAAGRWLDEQKQLRIAGGIYWMVPVPALVWGAFLGSRAAFAMALQELGWWLLVVAVAVTGISFAVFLFVMRKVKSSWVRGLEAEQRVGDHIEHALVRPGCAFAHDVKEALGRGGNVDHVVLTPEGVWVVETKAVWLDSKSFQEALQQVTANVSLLRRHLDGFDAPVRGALVIADNDEFYEADHDWQGEPVKTFRVASFWRRLQAECAVGKSGAVMQERDILTRKIWDLGSIRHTSS
ncbi:MAG: nuclease-related domain-containing protein [bacterium]|nr:nuclease-related domain-containing protein [bacterium]